MFVCESATMAVTKQSVVARTVRANDAVTISSIFKECKPTKENPKCKESIPGILPTTQVEKLSSR